MLKLITDRVRTLDLMISAFLTEDCVINNNTVQDLIEKRDSLEEFRYSYKKMVISLPFCGELL